MNAQPKSGDTAAGFRSSHVAIIACAGLVAIVWAVAGLTAF